MSDTQNESKGSTRREFIQGCAGAALAAKSASSEVLADDGRTKPNIVLVVADDHGADALGCYGNRTIKTPHLDRLAGDGVRFSHAFCTTASCSPSRSAILTGWHNHANGQYGLQHDFHHFQSFDRVKSLPVLLKNAGYRTARVGKFHVAPEAVYKFDRVLSEGKANDMQALGRNPVEMAEHCRDFISELVDEPFFLYFCTDDPHRGLPFDSWPGPNPFGNREAGYPGVRRIRYAPNDVEVPSFLPDIPECRAELAEYYESVSRVDQGVGRLVQILKDCGKYDNTVIIYISDNGLAFPGAKTTLYEPGMRLPCIVRTPWQKKRGITSDAMISWTDLAPTILDMAGAKPKEGAFHGRSFRSILDSASADGWDEIYGSHTFHEVTMYYPMRVVRGRRYKLIWNLASALPFPFAWDLKVSSTWRAVMNSGSKVFGKKSIETFLHRPEFELYDLQEDPDEVNNLAADKGYASILRELQEKLKVFQERTMDPWIADDSAHERWRSAFR
ncbi:MAG TPA: sulfatase [Acidobacteriota bacterium]|nr:sulfatase [Acidobacteriota bacterium]